MDIHAMASLQAALRERGHAMGRAVLEQAVTASLAHRGKLLAWLHEARRAPDDVRAVLEPRAAKGDAPRWLESKAAELAADDAIDALGQALEDRELVFQEYIRRVKMLAREQFFHCYAGAKSMGT